MARGKQDKAYVNFSNGFITEATGLTYPENSARDLDNINLELNGTARRRIGLNEEMNGAALGGSYFADTTYSGSGGPDSASVGSTVVPMESLAVSAHIWSNPASVGELNFIVFQIGNRLIVRDYNSDPISNASAIAALVSGPVEFTFDGSSTGFIYRTNKAVASTVLLQSSVGFGRIWFTSPAVAPFYMEYNPTTRVLSINRVQTNMYGTGIHLAIRDFNGVEDNLRVDEQPSSLSTAHRYNLYNQGWGNTFAEEYKTNQGKYPSNAQQWILGRDPVDMNDFKPAVLAKQDFGSGQAPRGRVIFDALLGVKTARDSDGGADVHISSEDEPSTGSFAATAFYAGRLWLAGDENYTRPNGVYFSKVLQTVEDAAVFMQVQDPTSEHFSDLLATDGGVIYIPEADHIERLEPFGVGLLVFARNGAWMIYGGDSGFSATSITIDKVSSTGIISPHSVVRSEQLVAFWANNGIHALALPAQGVIPVLSDLSVDKVYRYYNQIAKEAREKCVGAFDPVSKKIFWMYLDDTSYSYPAKQSSFNRALILDTRTGAFSKHSFSDFDSPYFSPSVAFPRHTLAQVVSFTNIVVVGSDAVVVGSDSVIVGEMSSQPDDFFESLKVVMLDQSTSSLRIAEFNDVSFYDYSMFNIGPTAYESYIITSDETLGDLQRNKSATYVHSFFKRTETGVDSNDDPIRPSACQMRGRWDWHTNIAGGRWTAFQNAYRYRRMPIPDDYETGDSIVYTKLKMRGRGHALALEYRSMPGKDFQLLGWSTAFTANGV